MKSTLEELQAVNDMSAHRLEVCCSQVPAQGVPYAAPAFVAGPMQPGVGYPAASAALPPPVRRPVAIEAPQGGDGGAEGGPAPGGAAGGAGGGAAGRGGGRRYSAMAGAGSAAAG